MEQPPDQLDAPTEEDVVPPKPSPVLTPNEVLFVFLASLVIGVIGVLSGIVPLIAIAMFAPVVAAMLA